MTSRAYVASLCRYISDNSTVAARTNREYGCRLWTAERVAKERARLGRPRRKEIDGRVPSETISHEAMMKRGSERLLQAVLLALPRPRG